VIRRHLPGTTASVLAEPRAVPGGQQIDWFSDLAGQPTPLLSLPAGEQAAARALLANRLASINKLADELPGLAPNEADFADALRQATGYPGDERVYVIDGEPVLTFWGQVSAQQARSSAAAAGSSGGRGRPLTWLVLALLLAAAATAGWFWLDQQREQTLLDALDAARSAECDPSEPLTALNARLEELDPEGSRYPDIRTLASAETKRCAFAQQFAADIDMASGDCDRLAALLDRLAGHDSTRQPLPDLRGRLAAELAICERARSFSARLEAGVGDCPALAVLDEELGAPPVDAAPLREARERLDRETALCGQVEQLVQELDANLGKCPQLLRIDGRIAGLDTSRPPLAEARERLDFELDLCAKAERYSQTLADAQTDCGALHDLDVKMQAEDSSREPLTTVRRRLNKALQACKSLDDLRQALQDALGDCKRLATLGRRLDEEEGLKHNPMVLEVKRRVADEMKICDLARVREQMLATAMGDCTALEKLKAKLASGPGADHRLGALSTRLEDALAPCREAAILAQRLESAGSDCSVLRALRKELTEHPKAGGPLDGTRTKLEAALRKCQAPVLAQAPMQVPQSKAADKREPREPIQGKPKAVKPVDTRKQCPGERPLELAPDLVIVFDASGSMSQPMSLDGRLADALAGSGAIGAVIGELAKMRGGETRIDVAKKATNSIVGALPNDVDVGLVLVEQCNQARPVGFFSPKQRNRLVSSVYSIQPVRGTPLASGIAKAASMIDGVKSPATIVVISDGKESCNGNPCAVAANIAKRKPMLTINVVDIMGTGAGTCAARATGGRVFAAKNAAELKSTLRRATAEVRGPANCRKK
jgi:Mg-chelatase subunit ChlD